MYGMRGRQVGPLVDDARLYRLVQPRRFRIGSVYDVDPARLEPRKDQVAALLACFAVTRAASIPAKMVQLVPDTRHGQAVNDLRMRRRLGIDIDRGKVIRPFRAGAVKTNYI